MKLTHFFVGCSLKSVKILEENLGCSLLKAFFYHSDKKKFYSLVS